MPAKSVAAKAVTMTIILIVVVTISGAAWNLLKKFSVRPIRDGMRRLDITRAVIAMPRERWRLALTRRRIVSISSANILRTSGLTPPASPVVSTLRASRRLADFVPERILSSISPNESSSPPVSRILL